MTVRLSCERRIAKSGEEEDDTLMLGKIDILEKGEVSEEGVDAAVEFAGFREDVCAGDFICGMNAELIRKALCVSFESYFERHGEI